ncbi:MAG: hypothetical protein B5M56_09225, partial [Desulfococcus sp. 4484_241]
NGSDDDGPYIRYNVNGIEIEQPAFKKLSQEIDLKKFKLASIDPVTMKPGPPLGKKYYEVCTNSALYEKLKKKS